MFRTALTAAVFFAFVACHAEPAAVESAWARATAGDVTVAWRAVDGELERNEERDVSLRVERGGMPAIGADVSVRGWMPDHGHGMVRTPAVREIGEGLYRVEGLLLHMRGTWDLHFDVRADDVSETVSFVLEL